jgi:hypothetical protein
MDPREDSYRGVIQGMTKMIADLRQESYKQLQRIEALEAAQQPADQVRGATEMVAPATEESSAAAPPAPNDRLRWCPTHGQQPRNAWGCPECVRELRAAAAPPAPAGGQRRYPSPATIAECGGPCDSQGPEACDCGLLQELNPPSPAPAGGLVERVADAIYRNGTGDGFREEARAAIREVAAAAEQMAPDKNLTWERVRLWLEVEAIR